jgi:hypothetical protein
MLDIEGVRRFIETGIMRLFQLAVLVGLGAYLYMGQDPLLGFLCVSFVPFAVWRGPCFAQGARCGASSRSAWRAPSWRKTSPASAVGVLAQQHEPDKFISGSAP